MTVAIRTEGIANEEAARISVRRINHIGRWRRIINPDRGRDTDSDEDCCLGGLRPKKARQANEGGESSEHGAF
jgi:hypothetical protein